MMKMILLYVNTIKDLKPIQIWYQIKRKLKRRMKKYEIGRLKKLTAPQTNESISILIKNLDFDEKYLERFSINDVMENKVTLLNETHEIKQKWKIEEASHLWNYNLHYLEFLIPLAVKAFQEHECKYYEKWKYFVVSWMNNVSEDSFEPYTISLRIPNLMICRELLKEFLGKDLEFDNRLKDSIYIQYKYLLKNQEMNLLANHYFENLKAIVVASLYFQEQNVFEKYYNKLIRETEEQILPDGIHYERSLMYHKIILEDILRVYKAIKSVKMQDDFWLPYINKMRIAIESLEQGFPRTPLFNDAGDNVAKSYRRLCKACDEVVEENLIGKFQNDFQESGYYRCDNGNVAVLFDCGMLGPHYMSGHAHNDTLSVEIAIDGKMLFVNSGTEQYQGKRRSYYRSTQAHNTFMIDDREQSELWGEHRAAKKIQNVTATRIINGIIGKYCSYCGDVMQRSLIWIDNHLQITDSVWAKDRGEHWLKVFWHLNPEYTYRTEDDFVSVWDGEHEVARIFVEEESKLTIYREGKLAAYSDCFGKVEKKEVLVIERKFSGTVSESMIIEFIGVK